MYQLLAVTFMRRITYCIDQLSQLNSLEKHILEKKSSRLIRHSWSSIKRTSEKTMISIANWSFCWEQVKEQMHFGCFLPALAIAESWVNL